MTAGGKDATTLVMIVRLLSAACLYAVLGATAVGAAERRIDLSSFDTVRVEGPFVVRLAVSPSPRGVMRGDPATLRQTEAAINGRTLVIRTLRDGTPPRAQGGPVELDIAGAPLSAITVIGGARVTAQAMRGAAMTLSITGAGEIGVDRADGDQLTATLFGPAKLTIGGGQVGRARLLANGPVALSANGLDAGDLSVMIEGPGEIDARARYTATVANNGLGRVTIAGTPKCRVTGGGSVRCGAK